MALVIMNMKTVVLLSTIFMLSISASFVPMIRAQDTYEEVLDVNGVQILFGADNTFTVWNVDTGIGYLRYFFSNGYSGDVVRTDTEITLGFLGNADQIYACQDNGSMVLVDVSSEGTPQQSLVKVRLNATDGLYRFQITQETPAVYVQFVLLSEGKILCTRGADGSRLQFQVTSSSTFRSADKKMPGVLVVGDVDEHRPIPRISSVLSRA